MKRLKITHFRVLSMFVLIAGLTFTSCNDSSTSAIGEKEMELTTHEGNDLMPNNTVSYDLIETLDVDARLVGDPAGPAISTNILESGVEYRITVDGNWSAWPADWWVGGDACSRFAVKYQSPSVPDGLYAGFDAEGRYATPGSLSTGAQCGDDLQRNGDLLFSLDEGQSYFDPTPLDNAFNTDHIYEYEVTGTGQMVAFLIPDTNGDNHGVFKVTIEKVVEDTTPPELFFNQVTGILWPPNHKMVLVATGISAYDDVDGATDVTVKVSSNEAPNGKGDGNTDTDWEVVENTDGTQDVYVRSERSGKGNGRTYTIKMSTSDVAGNSLEESFDVEVVHNQGCGRGR